MNKLLAVLIAAMFAATTVYAADEAKKDEKAAKVEAKKDEKAAKVEAKKDEKAAKVEAKAEAKKEEAKK